MKRILIIDNDKSFLLALENTLKYNHYEVETLANPLQTMELLEEKNFDCMLLDVSMPGINGLELLEQISRKQPLLPVIIVSGESVATMGGEAFEHGAYDFLEKPIETKHLLSTIRKAIEQGSGRGGS